MERSSLGKQLGFYCGILALAVSPLTAAEHLRVNPHLTYSSEANQGPLITGDHMNDGAVQGAPNLIFMYAQG